MTTSLLFLEGIGFQEMLLIMVVVLIFFGPSKIPDLARGLGKGIREFKDASSEIRNEFERAGQPHQGASNPNFNMNDQGYPAHYNPNQPVPPVAAAYPPAPSAEYSAPGAVVLPTAEPIAYPHDTPITPLPGHDGIPGTRPRLDQSST